MPPQVTYARKAMQSSLFGRAVAWLSTPARPEDAHLRDQLAAKLLDRQATLVISGGSTLVAASTAWILTHATWTIFWLIGDLILSATRVLAMEHAKRHPEIDRRRYLPTLMLTGLVWSIFSGIIGALCMASANAVVAVLGAVVTAGYAGGIVSRNAAVPRYGLIIIVFVLLPMAIGAAFSPYPGMALAGALIPIWALGTIGIMRQNHAILVRMMRAEMSTRQIALTDPLTGLHNRLYLENKLNELCAVARANPAQTFSVLLMDLDGFKQINDTYGHRAGDQLLEAVARRLSLAVRSTDFVCRLGGDEFVIVLPGDTGEMVQPKAQRIIEMVSKPYEMGMGDRFHIGVSAGGAHCPTEATDPHELLAAADSALYSAKAAGKGIYVSGRQSVTHLVRLSA